MNSIKHNASKIAVLTGLFLGAFALAALANWTPPHTTPPTCNPDLDPGCYAPINVGTAFQEKSGSLQIDNALGVVGTFIYGSGSPAYGKVLMSNDSNGTATWVSTSSLGFKGGGGGGSSGTLHTTFYNTTGVPSGFSLGVHDYCGFQLVQYGYGTSIGNSSMWLGGSAGAPWAFNYYGHAPDSSGVLCLDFY